MDSYYDSVYQTCELDLADYLGQDSGNFVFDDDFLPNVNEPFVPNDSLESQAENTSPLDSVSHTEIASSTDPLLSETLIDNFDEDKLVDSVSEESCSSTMVPPKFCHLNKPVTPRFQELPELELNMNTNITVIGLGGGVTRYRFKEVSTSSGTGSPPQSCPYSPQSLTHYDDSKLPKVEKVVKLVDQFPKKSELVCKENSVKLRRTTKRPSPCSSPFQSNRYKTPAEASKAFNELLKARKCKAYEIEPLSDPELEKCRKNSVNAKKNRDLSKSSLKSMQEERDEAIRKCDALLRELQEVKRDALLRERQEVKRSKCPNCSEVAR